MTFNLGSRLVQDAATACKGGARRKKSKAGVLYSRRMLGGDAFDEAAGETRPSAYEETSAGPKVVTEVVWGVNGS